MQADLVAEQEFVQRIRRQADALDRIVARAPDALQRRHVAIGRRLADQRFNRGKVAIRRGARDLGALGCLRHRGLMALVAQGDGGLDQRLAGAQLLVDAALRIAVADRRAWLGS
ncbi:hypothetical protein D3C72_1642170 [compost metagenome]